MKFSILLLVLLVSCTTNKSLKKTIDPYSASGFALIYEKNDYKNKIITKKFNNSKLEIGHNKIKKGSTVKVMNPENKKFVEGKVVKNARYPDFFKIVITKEISNKLELNEDIPFVDIQEKFKNESFVAKKAVTFSEEMHVSNKAPVTKVKIKNISSQKKNKNTKSKNFSIIVGDFYARETAEDLKYTIETNYLPEGSLNIQKLSKNKFRLTTIPYSSISTLKERYFQLNKYGFEDLDIKQHE